MKPVDNLWTTRRHLRSKPVDNLTLLDGYLTGAVRSFAISERLQAGSSRVRYTLTAGVCLVLGALLINMQPAQASSADYYRLYAHSRIVDFSQFICFNKIITKESNWRVNAVNGSHHGLGQMKSKHYKTLDPYRQIDKTLKYITKRYKTPCKAWAHHQERNWY